MAITYIPGEDDIMRDTRKKLTAVCFCAALCGILTACGQKQGDASRQETEQTAQTEIINIDQSPETTAAADLTEAPPKLIENQTFQISLKPLGEVTFSSYEPDTLKDPLGDVVFTLQKDGNTIYTLDGMYEDNSRPGEVFNEVEAVSFPDFDSDGNSDIVVICSYSPASGPDAGTGYSEARIYRGSPDGTFTLERGVTEAANSAVAEKTIQTILGFMGAGKEQASQSGWKEAYLSYLDSNDQGRWEGYNLIYVNDDDIPELAEIGNCEAAGCGILTFSEGTVTETILYRLNFTYIEKGNLLCNSDGNMDHYYDLVYAIIDGRMTQVAAGYYGAEDNSRLQLDEEGNPVYVYTFSRLEDGGTLPDSMSQALEQGPVLTEEEYARALNAVYDTSRAKSGYEWDKWHSLEEIKEMITAHE